MAIIIKIDTVDKSSFVDPKTITKRDNINEKVDTLSFKTRNYGSKVFTPQINSVVELLDGSDTLFAGVIVQVDQSVERKVIKYSVTCKDYSQYLDRRIVTERYTGMTVAAIIADLLTTYAPDFTDTNVGGAAVTIDSIAFNRITLSECFKKLAKLTNYSWYVDYDKDVHFFSKNTEPAPFNLTDDNGKFIADSLTIREDLSQIRNSILVEGGTKIGTSRTIYQDGDGTKDTFDTVVKFSNEPVVKVGGIVQTVGLENIDDDASFDCMWDYNQKYIRFTAGNIPAAGTRNIEITGTPLTPIVVRVPAPASISLYGLYEITVKDHTIISNEQAITRAKAEISAYADTIDDGSFSTYESGLRSGQVITINSVSRGKTFTALIQSVSLKFRDYEGLKPVYTVNFASLRSMGIIDYLLGQLGSEEIMEGEDETLLNYLQFYEQISITDNISAPTTSSPPYVFSNDAGTTPNKGRFNYSTFS